jgi:ATP-dependent DNA helicase DinG
MAKASYKWDLVNALPPMKRTKDRSEVEAFLRSLHEDGSTDEI